MKIEIGKLYEGYNGLVVEALSKNGYLGNFRGIVRVPNSKHKIGVEVSNWASESFKLYEPIDETKPVSENLDLEKDLSFEEVKHFFSKTGEFRVIDMKNDTMQIVCENDLNQIKVTLYKPTYQTLIRDIFSLGWRQHESKQP